MGRVGAPCAHPITSCPARPCRCRSRPAPPPPPSQSSLWCRTASLSLGRCWWARMPQGECTGVGTAGHAHTSLLGMCQATGSPFCMHTFPTLEACQKSLLHTPARYLEGAHPQHTAKMRITNNGMFDLHVDFLLKSRVEVPDGGSNEPRPLASWGGCLKGTTSVWVMGWHDHVPCPINPMRPHTGAQLWLAARTHTYASTHQQQVCSTNLQSRLQPRPPQGRRLQPRCLPPRQVARQGPRRRTPRRACRWTACLSYTRPLCSSRQRRRRTWWCPPSPQRCVLNLEGCMGCVVNCTPTSQHVCGARDEGQQEATIDCGRSQRLGRTSPHCCPHNALAQQVGLVEDVIVCRIRDNPEPVEFHVSAIGAKPMVGGVGWGVGENEGLEATAPFPEVSHAPIFQIGLRHALLIPTHSLSSFRDDHVVTGILSWCTIIHGLYGLPACTTGAAA